MNKLLLINSIVSLYLFSTTIAVGEESAFDRWTTLGKTNDGEVLLLNDRSVEIIDIQVDESINN
jgi:hypothetical protein